MRITLEENGVIAPYSIACGVYGLMVHTAFAGSKADVERKYQDMKNDLQIFLDSGDIDSVDCAKALQANGNNKKELTDT